MPVLHVVRNVDAHPHSVSLVLTTTRVVGLWPGVLESRTVDNVHHVTADLPHLGVTRMRITVTAPLRSADSFLVAFTVEGDLPPVAGAFRVVPSTDDPLGGAVLSLSVDHEHADTPLRDSAEAFLDVIAARVEERARDE